MKTLLALLLFATPTFAQIGFPPAQPTQQSPTALHACTKTSSQSAAVATQFTVTATPSGSNYVYVCAVDMSFCQDSTGVASTNVNFQFTAGIQGNLNGTANNTTLPIWSYSTALSINACVFKTVTFPVPIRGLSPGQAVSVQSPASSTHTGYSINVYWYEAP